MLSVKRLYDYVMQTSEPVMGVKLYKPLPLKEVVQKERKKSCRKCSKYYKHFLSIICIIVTVCTFYIKVLFLLNYLIFFFLLCIMLLDSLSAIAKNRPAFYGRILPVLLGFDPSTAVINGIRVSGARYALKNAFITCLKCTHQGAAPVCCPIPYHKNYIKCLLDFKDS